MTKYIDLLREHQPKEKGSKKAKKSKQSSKENPYAVQQDKDEKLLEGLEELLEEQDNEPVEQDDFLTEEYAQEMLVETDATEESPEVAETSPELATPTSAPITTEHGFDVSAWLSQLTQILTTMFTSVENNEAIHIETLDKHLNILFEQVQTSTQVLDLLELEINKQLKNKLGANINADLVQKSTTLMLYSIKVGMQLKLTLQDLLPHTTAAMLHHLGMAMVPADIRQKPSKLTKSEFKQIKQASQKALDYLETHNINHTQLISAISQSSERYNGSGASGLSGHEIAWTARLVSLLSMFEALIHVRPYRQRLLPRDAIRDIVKNHKKEFDPEMLKALIESISLYPVGTFIQLNTGEIGQVITVHTKFPLRPIVYINMDKYGLAITERKIDLKKQPNLMIQKCMYEEAVQEMTAEES